MFPRRKTYYNVARSFRLVVWNILCHVRIMHKISFRVQFVTSRFINFYLWPFNKNYNKTLHNIDLIHISIKFRTRLTLYRNLVTGNFSSTEIFLLRKFPKHETLSRYEFRCTTEARHLKKCNAKRRDLMLSKLKFKNYKLYFKEATKL